jgi:D-glycero-D-manno-heptose 1,7-bisphosphate phosphatase
VSSITTVFVDRDGVINRKMPEGEYVNTAADFELLPGAVDALAELTRAGMKVIVVTNQQGLAKGVTDPQAVEQIHSGLRASVESAGGKIDQILVCPHLAGSCQCRKPAVGLFEQALESDPQIEYKHSAVVGDSSSDIEAANQIGAFAILVTDRPAVSERDPNTATVSGLAEAVALLTGIRRG